MSAKTLRPLSRADLLYSLHNLGLSGGDAVAQRRVAPLLGWHLEAPEPSEEIKPKFLSASAGCGLGIKSEARISSAYTERNDQAPLLYAVQHYDAREPLAEDHSQEPEWFTQAKTLAETPNPNPQIAPPHLQPLVPWKRLWPLLRQALTRLRDSREPDVAKVIAALAQGQRLNRIPWQRRRRWTAAWVIIDASERLLPFWDDFSQLRGQIIALRGVAGLRLQHLKQGPQQCLSQPLPPAGTPVLILSDLGLYEQQSDSPGKILPRWQRLGRTLHQAGLRPIALLPCVAEQWPQALAPWFLPLFCDRSSPLRLQTHPGAAQPTLNPPSESVEKLLTQLAPALRIEPTLLRAMRHQLAPQAFDVRCEMALWRHPQIQRNLLGISLKAAARETYQPRFRALKAAQKTAVGELLLQHHAALAPEVLAHELQYADYPSPAHQAYLAAVVKTLAQQPTQGMVAWVARSSQRHDSQAWAQDQKLTAAWVFAQRYAQAQEQNFSKPEALDERLAAWAQQGQAAAQYYLLVQQGTELICHQHSPNQPWESPGSPVYGFYSRAKQLDWQSSSDNNSAEWRSLPLNQAQAMPSAGNRLHCRNGAENFSLEAFPRPAWADCVGRDEYGVFAEFSYKNISTRLRWIAPGQFMMGSPETEAERRDNEQLHPVMISQGFWLAETACTQALWQAVTGENPSHFKGEQRPVEQVSWDDVQSFLNKLNQALPGLALRLPSEAEWEYACRAGTDTPFHTGNNICTEKANYHGDYPYADNPRGAYRRETVDVKSFQPNSWGLYQMHGNVWEWCQDWYGYYQLEQTHDPIGQNVGEYHVLRGGSWLSDARLARSAYRLRSTHDFLDQDFSFRFARGQELPAAEPREKTGRTKA